MRSATYRAAQPLNSTWTLKASSFMIPNSRLNAFFEIVVPGEFKFPVRQLHLSDPVNGKQRIIVRLFVPLPRLQAMRGGVDGVRWEDLEGFDVVGLGVSSFNVGADRSACTPFPPHASTRVRWPPDRACSRWSGPVDRRSDPGR